MTENDIKVWQLIESDVGIELRTIDLPAQLDTFSQIAEHLPKGAYTTLRTYPDRNILRFDAHIQRLAQTAALVGMPQTLDAAVLKEGVRQVVDFFPAERELRIRLTLDLSEQPGAIYISAETLFVPAIEDYQKGVRVATCSLQRQLPKAKLTEFNIQANRVRLGMPDDVNEALMVGTDGCLLEGLSSNFFAVLEGTILTADQGVLSGTTRAMILEIINELELPLDLCGVPVSNLSRINEAFITSVSRGVLPVVQIDRQVIGSGYPGKITKDIMERYQMMIESQFEAL